MRLASQLRKSVSENEKREERRPELEGDATVRKLLIPAAVVAGIALALATASPARDPRTWQPPGHYPIRGLAVDQPESGNRSRIDSSTVRLQHGSHGPSARRRSAIRPRLQSLPGRRQLRTGLSELRESLHDPVRQSLPCRTEQLLSALPECFAFLPVKAGPDDRESFSGSTPAVHGGGVFAFAEPRPSQPRRLSTERPPHGRGDTRFETTHNSIAR